MKLYDLVNPNDLEEGIEDRLINVRFSEGGYRIYNYSDKAMYTPGAWDNPAVRQCRGLIVGPRDEIIARPWSKFFNHGQKEAGDLDFNAPVEVTDKCDGSLGILFINANGEPQISTRGSFESEMAVHATELFRERYMDTTVWDESLLWTFLFEIVYPGNRVVLDYGGLDDLILLGAVHIESGMYIGPKEAALILEWAGPVTEVFHYRTLKEALEAPPRKNAEGLCVRFLEENRIVKIKQEDYVALHKIVTRLSEKSVWEHMLQEKPLTELLDTLPDELVPWTQEVWKELKLKYASVLDAALDDYWLTVYSIGVEGTQKEFALAVQDLPNKHLLFRLHSNKDLHDSVMKMIKPVTVNKYRPYNEDIA